MKRVQSGRFLEHGDRVEIQHEYIDGEFRPTFTGTFLTRENVGHGTTSRIKRDDDGEHVHVHLTDEDIRAYRIDEPEHTHGETCPRCEAAPLRKEYDKIQGESIVECERCGFRPNKEADQ